MRLRATPVERHVHAWQIWRYCGTAVFRRCEHCDKTQHVRVCDEITNTPRSLRALADVPWQDSSPTTIKQAREWGYTD